MPYTQDQINRLPTKTYRLNTTCTASGWTPLSAWCNVWQDMNGNWWARIHIGATWSSNVAFNITVSGIVFKVLSEGQSLNMCQGNNNSSYPILCVASNSTIIVQFPSATITTGTFDGVAMLERKPDFIE